MKIEIGRFRMLSIGNSKNNKGSMSAYVDIFIISRISATINKNFFG